MDGMVDECQSKHHNRGGNQGGTKESEGGRRRSAAPVMRMQSMTMQTHTTRNA